MFYTEIQTIYLILTEAGGGTRKSFSESNVSDTELFLCETLLILPFTCLHVPLWMSWPIFYYPLPPEEIQSNVVALEMFHTIQQTEWWCYSNRLQVSTEEKAFQKKQLSDSFMGLLRLLTSCFGEYIFLSPSGRRGENGS